MDQEFDLKGRRLFIAIPAYDFKVTMHAAKSLAQFCTEAMRHGVDVQIGSICGCSVVARARNLLVRDFLDSDCTEMLFIDADINYEPDAIFRLMAFGGEDPKKGVMAVLPRTRSETLKFIGTPAQDEDGNLIMNGRGLLKAHHAATAFMWIKREVIQKLVDGNPEKDYYDERTGRMLNAVFNFPLKDGFMFDNHGPDRAFMGEDYAFCDDVRDMGYEIWIDPVTTLGHLGVQEFIGNYSKDWLGPRIQSIQEYDDEQV